MSLEHDFEVWPLKTLLRTFQVLLQIQNQIPEPLKNRLVTQNKVLEAQKKSVAVHKTS